MYTSTTVKKPDYYIKYSPSVDIPVAEGFFLLSEMVAVQDVRGGCVIILKTTTLDSKNSSREILQAVAEVNNSDTEADALCS